MENPEKRMQGYLGKIATGPRMSKDLTREEAQDGLTLVLDGAVSDVRAALFLITTRMKLETEEENLGFWQALDAATVKTPVPLDALLTVADAFDGFERVPYHGFYALPLLAEMGLPACGHSSLPQPPKFGPTFEDILQNHYGMGKNGGISARVDAITKHRFGFIGTAQCTPKLERLRGLRREIVKRPMLATLEKMLQPLTAKTNYLATNYFHPGYEVSMLAVARTGGFDRAVIGNGMEGGTLYGVHKRAKVFIKTEDGSTDEKTFDAESLFAANAPRILQAHRALKETPATREAIAQGGEAALRGEDHPAAEMIAVQAAVLLWLLGLRNDADTAYEDARAGLSGGGLYEKLMRYLDDVS